MNSFQEKVLFRFAQKSMGAPFVFTPEEYRKGNSVREPADLVWACNNCIFLFYLTSRENNKEAIDSVIEGRVQKMIKHNISQAKGWLQEWRDGKPIIGMNKYNSFEIYYDDYKYKIVLSIVDYSNSEGSYHNDYCDILGVDLCATISQKSFQYLTQVNASALDFILLINDLKKYSQINSYPGFMSLGRDYFDQSRQYAFRSMKKSLLGMLPDDKMLISVTQTFNLLRESQADSFAENRDSAITLSSILNDITLKEYYVLSFLLAQQLTQHYKDVRQYVVYFHPFDRYLVVVGIANSSNIELIGVPMLELANKIEKDNPEHSVITLLYETSLPNIVMGFRPINGKSQCELAIE